MDSKVVIVTGGGGDLASAIVSCFEEQGWEVLDPNRIALDVTDPDSVSDFFGKLEKIDLLINNAGLTRDVVHTRMSEEDWDLVMDTNLKGSFLCSRAGLRLFPRKEGGHIINIGSFSGKSPPVGQANYAAAKSGLIGLTQSLAREYGKRKIRVNCVLPGFLETKMTAGLSENAKQRIRDRHTLGSFNSIDDAARFVHFLDSMKEVSGQVFQLDSRVS